MSRYCEQCAKAKSACICHWIKPLPSNIEVVILQHQTEQNRPLGTAIIADLSLSQCQTFVGENFSDNHLLTQLFSDDKLNLVLFPTIDSICLTQLGLLTEACAESGSLSGEQSIRLIVLDGTWKKARKIWELNTVLHGFTCVTLPEQLNGKPVQGNYRIRKAPSRHHLSTIEAIYYSLTYLESNNLDNDYSNLLTVFDNMVDFQIKQMPEGVFERNYHQ